MLYWLADSIIHGYIFSTIAFLLLIVIHKPSSKKTKGFLNIANLIVLFGLLLNIIIVVIQTVTCKKLQVIYFEENQSADFPFQYTTNCYAPLFRALVLGAAFQSLFIFKKYRIKVAATIVSVLLLTVLQFFANFAMLIANIYRDYIPSSWGVYYSNWYIIWKILSPVIYFTVCWVIASGRLSFKRSNTDPAT